MTKTLLVAAVLTLALSLTAATAATRKASSTITA